jgi:hypothetical protein
MSAPLDSAAGNWPRAARAALGLWGLALIIILCRGYLQPTRNSVYPIFANAGREWLAGVDLYDKTLQRPVQDHYRYAPIVAAAFSPLTALDDPLAAALWRVINGAVYLAGLVVFLRTVCPGSARLDSRATALLALALLPLSVGSLNNGQPNALVAGCLLLAAAAVVRERWAAAGVCLAVPVLFKVYPLAVVLLFFLIRPRQLGWRTGLVVAAGCLAPFVLHDPDYVSQIYRTWFSQVSGDDRREFALEFGYRDFHTLTRVAGMPMAPLPYLALQLAAAAGVAVLVLRGRWLGWPVAQQCRAALDLGLGWIILFGPATENCTYILLAPTLALATVEALDGKLARWRCGCVLGALALFIGTALVTAVPMGRYVSYWLMPIAGLVLVAERVSYHARFASCAAIVAVEEAPFARAA